MLGPLTEELISKTCPTDKQSAIRALLTKECARNLPLIGDTPEYLLLIDRIQLATLRGADWEIAKIAKAVALAKVDWRDVLMGAGFGHSLSAHIEWQREALKP